MYSETIFYLSRVLGKKVYNSAGDVVGTLRDIVVANDGGKPQVVAFLLRNGMREFLTDAEGISVVEVKGQFILRSRDKIKYAKEPQGGVLYLRKNVLDRQIVDINGVKMVRVNDLRMAQMSAGIYVVAVDVGIEGLLRRIGLAKPLKKLVGVFGGGRFGGFRFRRFGLFLGGWRLAVGGNRFEVDRHRLVAGPVSTGRGFRFHGGLLAFMCIALNVDREAGEGKTLAAISSAGGRFQSSANRLSSSGAEAIETCAAKSCGTAAATLRLMQSRRTDWKRSGVS